MGKEKKEKKAETSTAEPAEVSESTFQCYQITGTLFVYFQTTIGGEMSYEDKLSYVAVIAKPMANKKLAKKAYKLIKKGMKHKTFVRNGLKVGIGL